MKGDTLTITVARGNWRISRTITLATVDASHNKELISDTIEEIRRHLELSWLQLPPHLKKSLLRVEHFVPQPQA